MYICICNAITECQIKACAEQGACSLTDLEHCLGVGAGCGRCRRVARDLLDKNRAERTGVPAGGRA